NTPSGSGAIACDLNLRQIKLTMNKWTPEDDDNYLALAMEEVFSATFQPTASALYWPSQIKKLIASGVSSSSSTNAPLRIFLESSTAPTFEQQSFVSERSNNAQRCSSLERNVEMSPGCAVLCIT